MSLWRRDLLRIGLGPDRLVVAGYRRGVQLQLVRRDIISVEAGEAHGWQASIDALPGALLACGFRAPEVSVVVSNSFARYALLASNPAIRSESEWIALARHRLASVHGADAEGWELCLSETVRGGARIACAIDGLLLDALQAKVAEGRARLHSVRPYLMAAFNRIRPKIGDESCWLVIEEPECCIVLALIQRGHWVSIRMRRVDEHWRSQLCEILKRESALLALSEPCTKVVAYTANPFEIDSDADCQMRDLTLAAGNAPVDQPLAMALA